MFENGFKLVVNNCADPVYDSYRTNVIELRDFKTVPVPRYRLVEVSKSNRVLLMDDNNPFTE